MEFVPLLATIGLAIALGNLVKQLFAGETKHVATQLVIWFITGLLILLLGASDFATSVVIGEYSLASLDVAAQIIFALFVAGNANTLYDIFPNMNTPTIGAKTEETV